MTQDEEKRLVGEAAAELVADGMTLGLGTGSTVTHFLNALGRKVKAGMTVRGVATSERTANHCHALGIELLDIASVDELDLTVDGADEIDHAFRMIKGGGGALLREKVVAELSRRVVIVVDSSKVVDTLGGFPLPVEVVRFGHSRVERILRGMGVEQTLRFTGDDPYITDNGHYILDCRMGPIVDPEGLAAKLKGITGIVDSGLFVCHCHALIVARDGKAVIHEKPGF